MLETHSPISIKFTVQRGEPELLTPAKPTPYEFKQLSDLDSQDWLRGHVRIVMAYPHNPDMNEADPAKLIRAAVAETLALYYPFAGRLREDPTGKLIVECTGEGILFIKANADVTLDQFGYPLVPPFPCLDQLLYEEPSSNDILNCPLVLIQVTRLKCGGFIFALRLNHTMSDGAGLAQFVSAIGEIARGATSPSVLPVWERHVLDSKNSVLPKYNNDIHVGTNNLNFPLEHDLCYKTFIFGPIEISALRKCLPLHLRHCSSFEILTAFVWKCRVAALEPLPTKEISLLWGANLRNKASNFIPSGYYGNALAVSILISTAKEILENPLCHTLQLMKNTEENVSTEYHGQSLKNLILNTRSYSVSDIRYVGLEYVDFGWGKPIYATTATCVPMLAWFYQMRKHGGLKETALAVCLPKQEMERFEMELNNILSGGGNAILSKL